MTAPAPPEVSHSGYLKLELGTKGMRLDDAARSRSGVHSGPQLENETERGLELVLPDDVVVRVPIDDAASGDSPFVLSGSSERFTLHRNGGHVDVRVVPQPQFYTRSTSSGRVMRQVGAVHGPFIAINPAGACGYSLRGAPCRFCRSGSGAAGSDRFAISVQDVLEVVRAAFAEGAVEFVYFNPPFSGSEDGGIAALEPYIEAVKKHFDTLVAVQIHPPQAFGWITRTYAMGVDALSYGIEIHDAEILSRRCPGRVRYIGRERYYEALAHAASVFPSGTVWSDLILGVEPAESTMRGIDTLVSAGALPILSVVRGGGSEPPSSTLPDLDAVRPVFAHLFRSVQQSRINTTWLPDLSFAITPLEARLFAGDDARLAPVMQQFYRSKLGTLAARSLSRLRRSLRVRTVGSSLEASRL